MDGLLIELSLGTGNATTPQQWAVVALGVLTIIYVAVVRPLRKAKSKRDPLERPARPTSLAHQRAVERDMSNLLVEYEEMIRRMTAQVDTRATRLELLIREAEEKIAQLKALSTTEAGGNGSAPGGNAPASEAVIAQTGAAPQGSVAGERPDSAADEVTSPDGAAPVAAGDARYAEVYRLADNGRTAQQIAQELNRPYGEVELILRLRNPRQRQATLWEPAVAKPADAPFPGQIEAVTPPEAPAAPQPAEQRRKARKKQRS